MTLPEAYPQTEPGLVDSARGGPTDVTLVERARRGDAAAFESIMRRYNQRLYRLARSILRDPFEAEDVVQEAYVRAYLKLADFRGPSGFSAWLSRIAMNEALGRLRQRGRVISLEEHMDQAGRGDDELRMQPRSAHPGPERLAASLELRHLIEQAVDRLPEEFRTVFVLRAIDGLSVAETAACLGIRAETVKTRFHRARRLLQRSLGEQVGALMPSLFEFGGERCDRVVRSVLARVTRIPATER